MRYLGITQKTANWLLTNKSYIPNIVAELNSIVNTKGLSEGVIAVGSLRITGFDNQVISIWNNDYLSGTGYEDWAFIKLQPPFGLLEIENIIEEVLTRELYIINQRLQGLVLGDTERYLHRNLGDNHHTCLVGWSDKTKNFSIGYYEDTVKTSIGVSHSLICVGPSNISGFDAIKRQLTEASHSLISLIESSNKLLSLIKNRPILDVPYFKGIEDRFHPISIKKKFDELGIEEVPELEEEKVSLDSKYSTLDWTYNQWMAESSTLTNTQRLIVESDIIIKHPLRIIGAAGTGKSLIMQLLAMRQLENAKAQGKKLSILYVVHNSEIANSVQKRFETLGGVEYFNENNSQKLLIRTLFEHSWKELKLIPESIINKDASETKKFQRDVIADAIEEIFKKNSEKVAATPLFSKYYLNDAIKEVFTDLFNSEISISIKGRDLISNKKKYVESERPLSRFHGVLNKSERELLFEVFESYHKTVFEELELLDSDDVAISFLSNLKTPLWQLQRKKLGFDFVFVDETQLFNQNERQLFRLLPKHDDRNLPLALAIDEAQEIRGSTSSGFGVLGIEGLADEVLPQVHRSTPDILKLAFFVIQQTTDLFGPDFPDFTNSTDTLVSGSHPLAQKPKLIVRNSEANFSRTVRNEINELRKSNFRQIAVVVHTEKYWNEIKEHLEKASIPLLINTKRGELIDPQKPIIFLTKPENVGGQEFGAVISIGLEFGVAPPLVDGHAGLAAALEQQFLRELYLVFTRAKYRLIIINSKNSIPSSIIQNAINNNLITKDVS